MLTSLSSASRMRLPSREKASSPPSAASAACACLWAMAKGRMMVKVVPSPGALSTWISPFICVTMLWVMGMPSPVPTA